MVSTILDSERLEGQPMNSIRVAVLMGGDSTERAVSLRSGRAIAGALAMRGYAVSEVDLAGEADPALARLDADVCFISIHGGFGEDGRLQRRLEDMRMAYTGSGRAASDFAMDKLKSKLLFSLVGVPTAPYRIARPSDSLERVMQLAGELGFPVVIKPRAQGSSVGVSIHRGPETLAEGLAHARATEPVALVEKFIAGRELTVGVLCGRVLPVIELKPAREFFDYHAKYQDPDTRYIVDPQDLDSELKRRAQEAALRAHEALHCVDLSRVDLILAEDGTPFVLEVNTIPGMTERSLLPKAAAAAGIEYPLLCHMIVQAAIERAIPLAEVA